MAVAALKIEGAQALLAAHSVPAGEAGWARAVRERAAGRLNERGAPVRRDEYWRFSDPAPLTAPMSSVELVEGDDAVFEATDRVRLVFVDGVFAPDESDALELAGVEIHPLNEVLRADIHWARDLFGVLEARGQDPVDRPLASLNTARATEGVVIRATGRAERPLHLIYRRESDTSDVLVRHLVQLEAGADLTVLESGVGAARMNTVMEIDIGEGAGFHHVRTQGLDAGRRTATALFARLARESTFKSFTLAIGGQLTRNEAVIEFTGDNGVAHVAGAGLGRDGFVHDDTIFITHDGAHCESRQVFKKVLRSGAVGIFQGKILVKPGAQKTDGYQISQGLLMDDDSQFLAKPELEIYADDVVCSHGSTSGAVDEDALFYLTSRGVPRRQAEELLVLAFLDDAVAEIEDEGLATDIRGRLARWLAQPQE